MSGPGISLSAYRTSLPPTKWQAAVAPTYRPRHESILSVELPAAEEPARSLALLRQFVLFGLLGIGVELRHQVSIALQQCGRDGPKSNVQAVKDSVVGYLGAR